MSQQNRVEITRENSRRKTEPRKDRGNTSNKIKFALG